MNYEDAIKKLKLVNCEYDIPKECDNNDYRGIFGLYTLSEKIPGLDGVFCTDIHNIDMDYDREIEYKGKKHYQYTCEIGRFRDMIYDISIYSNLKPIDVFVTLGKYKFELSDFNKIENSLPVNYLPYCNKNVNLIFDEIVELSKLKVKMISQACWLQSELRNELYYCSFLYKKNYLIHSGILFKKITPEISISRLILLYLFIKRQIIMMRKRKLKMIVDQIKKTSYGFNIM